jgi:hypothetical protein
MIAGDFDRPRQHIDQAPNSLVDQRPSILARIGVRFGSGGYAAVYRGLVGEPITVHRLLCGRPGIEDSPTVVKHVGKFARLTDVCVPAEKHH